MSLSPLLSTYKHMDVEETLDIYFTRPLGYVFALASRFAGLSPNVVTIIGMVVGALGGHLLFYSSMKVKILGILLFILSGILDSSDGMLARMTGEYSKLGRILDGIADNVKFVSVYFHLCLGFVMQGGSGWIFALALIAGISHSMQGSAADYIRSAYLHFAEDKKKDWDDPVTISKRFKKLSWKENLIEKMMIALYLNHSRQQRMLFKNYNHLLNKTVYMPSTGKQYKEFAKQYRAFNRPMLKYCNILTTNTRSIVLYIAVLIGMPVFFFLFEIAILNSLLAYVVLRQEANSRKLLRSSMLPEIHESSYEAAA